MADIHVIVPVYNAKKYLREAVESVLNQPYNNIDILLVDDGSTDGSGDLCDMLAQENNRVSVIHQQNGGVSAARNTGIDYVLEGRTSGYIVFLDADDFWLPNAIGEYFFVDKPACDMYIMNMVGCNQDANRFSILTEYEDELILDTTRIIWEWESYFVSHIYSCDLLRRHNIRFPTQTHYVEDRMFDSICLNVAHSAYRCKKILYAYRYNNMSAMHTKAKISAIDYYAQIISGWLYTDDFINSRSSATGRKTKMGHTLAAIYVLDMAATHYQYWSLHGKLASFFDKYPLYHLLENVDTNDISIKQCKDMALLKEHPVMFRMKHRLLGVIGFSKRIAFALPCVKKIYMVRKYPLTIIPEN